MKDKKPQLVDWLTYLLFPILLPILIYRWVVMGSMMFNATMNGWLSHVQANIVMKEEAGKALQDNK